MDVTDLSNLVKLHGKAVYGFCYKLAKNRDDADDLYQETFLKAMELRHKIDKDNNPKGFLISTAIKLWKNNRRKYARRQRIAPTEELIANENTVFMSEPTPEDIVISNELCTTIQAASEKLSTKLKIPLYMYYTAEMSNEDIASSLNIPEGTVKSRLHKARKKLKEIMDSEAGKYE